MEFPERSCCFPTKRFLVSGLLVVTISLWITACGSDTMPVSAESSGVFLDSAVQGLSFSTPSQTGITDAAGTFSYLEGESVIFSIGNLDFPETRASSVVTPLEVFGESSARAVPVVNLSRLLQSLDIDGDAGNGITIAPEAALSASSVDFSGADFDQQVINLIANSGSVNSTLVEDEVAIAHLEATLVDNGLSVNGCTSEHPLVGRQAEFETRFHGVAGLVRIVDDCTIRISGFNYDGQGPQVYFYGALDGRYSAEQAFIIGERLDGTVYVNDELVLTLPAGSTLDEMNGISVWCADFDINFGSAEFAVLPE